MKIKTLSRGLKKTSLIVLVPLLLGMVLATCSAKEPTATETPVPTVISTDTPVPVRPTATQSQATSVSGRPTQTPGRVATATATSGPTRVNTPIPVRETVRPVEGAVAFPIEVVDASSLGSLQFEITYDPKVLEFRSVNTGPLATQALLVSNLVAPGRLKVALADISGISGEGIVIVSQFLAMNQRGATDLFAVIEEASDTDLRELAVKVSPGAYSGPDNDLVPLILHFLK